MFVGGIRALLEQALHPEAMAGVAAHSNFREDAWGRLQRTGDYVGTLTFGTIDEAENSQHGYAKFTPCLSSMIKSYCSGFIWLWWMHF